jgi:hypothetical protein
VNEPTLTGRAVAVGLVLVAIASLGFASRFVHDPLMADEIYLVIAADHIRDGGRPITRTKMDVAHFASADLVSGPPADERDTGYALWHPPLYLHVVALVFGLAGTGAAQARLIGLGCLLTTILIIYAATQQVFRDRPDRRAIGLLAAFLFALNPLAIQGALVVDIDNTLLAPALLLTLLAVVRSPDGVSTPRDLGLGALFAGLFWIKLTTPLALLLALAIFVAAREGVGVALRRAGVVGVVGGAGFLGTWIAYAGAQGLPAIAPFQHLVASAVGTGPHGPLSTVAREAALAVARVALWISPFLVLLWGISLARRASELASARPLRSEDLLHLTAAIVLSTYLVVGRTTFGFPRYDYPVLPLLAILGAASALTAWRTFAPRSGRWLLATLVGAALVWLGGDPLLSSYAMVRERLVAGLALDDVIGRVALQVAVLGLTPLAIASLGGASARFGLARAAVLPLAAATVSYSLALDAIQARADYLVRYGYGGVGTREVLAFLGREVHPESLLLAPAELIYGIGNRASPFPANGVWTSAPALVGALSVTPLRAFVYGLPTNTIEQVRFIERDPRVLGALRERFRRWTIGSYTVWVRGP